MCIAALDPIDSYSTYIIRMTLLLSMSLRDAFIRIGKIGLNLDSRYP